MGIVQEKFQVEFEPRPKRSHEWATPQSARVNKVGLVGLNLTLNDLPPGENIEDQGITDQPAFASAMTGGSNNDVTPDNTAMALMQGFTRKPMKPTDDMYTREHNDAFYDSIVVDGVEGFVERNNVLDRE